ncbi:deoxygluconate dehydrogenase [Yersinia entomophaga]|uniref:Deoxygluconate dehydrogenase n=1 Tax=Yersinia entomophaga TaxID=935293 RepID=A0ABN4PVX9_YERET|nr:SDR family oxidoreductase [Yersinia entomophaga]ANI31075.1 deoxygluconate dehydrogenase [Yersinia entomophaga]OWF84681.1 deoxygluconate dehydrogenase [Yersinia entomophaga]
MLQGKRAVVTGGGRDFGQAVSVWLAREGAEVVLCSRVIAQAQATVDIIRAEGGIAEAYECDISDMNSVRQFSHGLLKHEKPIDILLLSAAQWLEGDLQTGGGDEDIISTINAGLTGSILLTKALLPRMNREQGSDIIAMVSVCGVPNFTQSNAHPAFFAAKQGFSGFCHTISQSLAAENIRLTALYPPDFETLGFDEDISHHNQTNQRLLTGQSIWQTVKFVVTQPRSCHINAIHFQGPSREPLG